MPAIATYLSPVTAEEQLCHSHGSGGDPRSNASGGNRNNTNGSSNGSGNDGSEDEDDGDDDQGDDDAGNGDEAAEPPVDKDSSAAVSACDANRVPLLLPLRGRHAGTLRLVALPGHHLSYSPHQILGAAAWWLRRGDSPTAITTDHRHRHHHRHSPPPPLPLAVQLEKVVVMPAVAVLHLHSCNIHRDTDLTVLTAAAGDNQRGCGGQQLLELAISCGLRRRAPTVSRIIAASTAVPSSLVSLRLSGVAALTRDASPGSSAAAARGCGT